MRIKLGSSLTSSRSIILKATQVTFKTADARQAQHIESVRTRQIDEQLSLEYLVLLDDGSKVWLATPNVAEDLRKRFAAEWWIACREADTEKLQRLLTSSTETLVNSRDAKQRSAIHFLAGIGDVKVLPKLLFEGTNVNAKDDDGYTALHLAAGYMQLESLNVLLNAGADAEIEDNTGRSAQGLVSDLLNNTPVTTAMYSRRVALEAMLEAIEGHIYEDVVPAKLVKSRTSNGQTEYLVQWIDGYNDMWISERDIADDIIISFQDNVEQVQGWEISSELNGNNEKRLIKWRDSDILTW
eukprot:CAMPEP_0174578458 /NCGR_PEP_ID=MMETSP0929-20130131/851_1 /TAXON_ID=548131 ORGANISM="Ostreococcus mediterraneus, Strain clade-D-RCC2572" /NCGR_SAMPLE_ID=MMETSP0929 /ASSEMBLY_ACC=CAM_ASM_000573 /LENGTH=297 /DNA_ID=CAMNT_0015759591 /DNA_START=321 /DNA_END=1211 /DNA_ORIENTATION=+